MTAPRTPGTMGPEWVAREIRKAEAMRDPQTLIAAAIVETVLAEIDGANIDAATVLNALEDAKSDLPSLIRAMGHDRAEVTA